MDAKTFDAILIDVAAGVPTWKALAAREVSTGDFTRYRRADEERMDKYARAKQEGIEGVVEDGARIADDPDIDHNHKRIMVDFRKWYASKLAPRVYGDKLELAGEVGLNVNVVDYTQKVA